MGPLAAARPHPIPGIGRIQIRRGFSWCLALPGKQLRVRLVNGSSRCSGTVEVQIRQSWEPTCGAFWNSDAAEAVCRTLGCGGAAGVPLQPIPPRLEMPRDWATGNASGAQNGTQALAPFVVCTGNEWQLCEVEEHPCISDQRHAQVTCAGTAGTPFICPLGPCLTEPLLASSHGPSLLSPALGTAPKPRPLDSHPHASPIQTQLVHTPEYNFMSFPALSISSDLASRPLSLLGLQLAHLAPNPTPWVPSPNRASRP